MNNTSHSNNWSSTKTKLKHKFDKFTDEYLESFKENMDGLSAKLQSVYGYAKDKAEKEVSDFKAALKTEDNSQKTQST